MFQNNRGAHGKLEYYRVNEGNYFSQLGNIEFESKHVNLGHILMN